MNKPSNTVLLVIFIVIVLLVVIAFFVKTKRYNANGNGVRGLGEFFTAESVIGSGPGIMQFFAKGGKCKDEDSKDAWGNGDDSSDSGSDSDDEDKSAGSMYDYDDDNDDFDGMGYSGFDDIYGSGKAIIVGTPVFNALIAGEIDTIVVPNLKFAKGINAGNTITIVKAKPKDGTDSPRPYRAKATVVSKLETTENSFDKIVKDNSSFKIVPAKSKEALSVITSLFDEFKGKATDGHIIVKLENVNAASGQKNSRSID